MAKNYQKGIRVRFLKVIDEICKAMTARELCQSLNISEAALSSIRSGTIKSLKAELIAEICERYKFSILWVMTGNGDMKADESTRSLQQEIAHIKEILGEIIKPLLNEVITAKVTIKPDKKNPLANNAIQDLLKSARGKSN